MDGGLPGWVLCSSMSLLRCRCRRFITRRARLTIAAAVTEAATTTTTTLAVASETAAIAIAETAAAAVVAVTIGFTHHRRRTFFVLADADSEIAQNVFAQTFLPLDLVEGGRWRVEIEKREMRFAVLTQPIG